VRPPLCEIAGRKPVPPDSTLFDVAQVSPVLIDVGFALSDPFPLGPPLVVEDAGPRLVDLGAGWQVQLHAQIDAAHHVDIPFTDTQPARVDVALSPSSGGAVWVPASVVLLGEPSYALLIDAMFAKAHYAPSAADVARIDVTGVVSTYARFGGGVGIS
jgi:hypothetical protein